MKLLIGIFTLYVLHASEALDVSEKLKGGTGYEYEKQKTKATAKISTNCGSCKIIGGKSDLFDGETSTKFALEATSASDIASSNIVVNIDVRYNTRKTHLNHFSVTSGNVVSFDPSRIGVQGRNGKEDTWKDLYQEDYLDWSGRQTKMQFVFNNKAVFFEHRISLRKKATSTKIEISDTDLLRQVLSKLSIETFYKLNGIQLFTPAIIQPKGELMIGMIKNPGTNFIVSLDLLPLGKVGSFANVYRFRSDPQSSSNYQTVGDRQPCLNFYPGTFGIEASFVDKGGYKQYRSSTDNLKQNVESTVITKVVGDLLTLYVDGKQVGTAGTKLSDRPEFSALYAFASDNVAIPANVKIKNLRFTNIKLKDISDKNADDINNSKDTCAVEDAPSKECGAASAIAAYKCCDGLICRGINCVKDCAPLDETSKQCGATVEGAFSACCDGLTCNKQGKCVEPCAALDETSKKCGDSSAEAQGCCAGLTCDSNSNKCVEPCAALDTYSKKCGVSYGSASECCEGTTCNPFGKCIELCAKKNVSSKQCGATFAKANKCCNGLVCNGDKCVEPCASLDETSKKCGDSSAEAQGCCAGLICDSNSNKCVKDCAPLGTRSKTCGASFGSSSECCEGTTCNPFGKCVELCARKNVSSKQCGATFAKANKCCKGLVCGGDKCVEACDREGERSKSCTCCKGLVCNKWKKCIKRKVK